jgi:hypothetical protein
VDLFERSEIIKPSMDADSYVAWDGDEAAPVWAGTCAEALAAGAGSRRISRADWTGSSLSASNGQGGHNWAEPIVYVRPLGYIARDRLAGYATAWTQGRKSEAYSMLEAFVHPAFDTRDRLRAAIEQAQEAEETR